MWEPDASAAFQCLFALPKQTSHQGKPSKGLLASGQNKARISVNCIST